MYKYVCVCVCVSTVYMNGVLSRKVTVYGHRHACRATRTCNTYVYPAFEYMPLATSPRQLQERLQLFDQWSSLRCES